MGATTTEGDKIGFPPVETKLIGGLRNTSQGVSFEIRLHGLQQIVENAATASEMAAVKGTPIPSEVVELFNRAKAICDTCHLTEGFRSMGEGVAVNCSGFTDPEVDLFILMIVPPDITGKSAIMNMKPDKEVSVLAALTTPCGIVPADLYQ